jgi:hypothetical protein
VAARILVPIAGLQSGTVGEGVDAMFTERFVANKRGGRKRHKKR